MRASGRAEYTELKLDGQGVCRSRAEISNHGALGDMVSVPWGGALVVTQRVRCGFGEQDWRSGFMIGLSLGVSPEAEPEDLGSKFSLSLRHDRC